MSACGVRWNCYERHVRPTRRPDPNDTEPLWRRKPYRTVTERGVAVRKRPDLESDRALGNQSMRQSELGEYECSGERCPKCSMVCKTRQSLGHHFTHQHDEKLVEYERREQGDFPCPDCECRFNSEMAVKVHHGKKHDGTMARPIVNCSNCGEEKRTTTYRKREASNHFCDHQCRAEWLSGRWTGSGHPNWKETPTHTCEICGEEYRRPPHVSTTRWCSLECQMKGISKLASHPSGSDSPIWRGGSSITDALRKCLGDESWRLIASRYREQQKGRCEWCGEHPDTRGSLHVHHIVPIRCGGCHHQDNLMALCRTCHKTCDRYIESVMDRVLTDGLYRPDKYDNGKTPS